MLDHHEINLFLAVLIQVLPSEHLETVLLVRIFSRVRGFEFFELRKWKKIAILCFEIFVITSQAESSKKVRIVFEV